MWGLYVPSNDYFLHAPLQMIFEDYIVYLQNCDFIFVYKCLKEQIDYVMLNVYMP